MPNKVLTFIFSLSLLSVGVLLLNALVPVSVEESSFHAKAYDVKASVKNGGYINKRV